MRNLTSRERRRDGGLGREIKGQAFNPPPPIQSSPKTIFQSNTKVGHRVWSWRESEAEWSDSNTGALFFSARGEAKESEGRPAEDYLPSSHLTRLEKLLVSRCRQSSTNLSLFQTAVAHRSPSEIRLSVPVNIGLICQAGVLKASGCQSGEDLGM